MGARVYIPPIGRFLQVDPIEGGTENNYVYPTDPVNEFDLTGELSLPGAYIASPTIAHMRDCKNNGQVACAEHRIGEAFTAIPGVGVGGRLGGILSRSGAEIKIGSRLRISLLGNKGAVGQGGIGKNIPAILPHIHYRPTGAPAKIMKLHRPWETLFRKLFK